ncbi:MFS transporter [Aquirhabdus parva]|uniref:MFS transporter n=1 Tax=Aquirhabdus parva TaxID=2283318 RepID=A0A345P2S5_9GAMM|nr:MFS transporter [Aquirhabdus parva]AXI01584.1 MFS transporter [Aquirhabdus parva]
MKISNPFAELTGPQLHAFIAALSGWSLDAFDFFLFVFAIKSIAGDFHTDVKAVSEGIFLTLAMRPVGALLFGWLAERYGRRPILMINVVSFAICELASAFAPSLAVLLAFRALFGLAMGGEWGIGAALALETLPATNRGFFSGLLQEGYVLGYLMAALVFKFAFDHVGWRGMFIIGALPALLVFFIRRSVQESPAWLAGAKQKRQTIGEMWGAVRGHIPLMLFMVVIMVCFTALSHGSQDLYPTFLQVQHGYGTDITANIAIVLNLGALCGGVLFGSLSSRLGRRKTIALAALLVLPMIPLWAYAATPVMFALGAFCMQLMVQGAWGVVPAHLNELSPPAVRAILPGFAYQLGNLATSKMAPFQASIAESHSNNFALALSWTIGVAAVILAIVAWFGYEAKDVDLTKSS